MYFTSTISCESLLVHLRCFRAQIWDRFFSSYSLMIQQTPSQTLNVPVILFADDLKMFWPINTIQDCNPVQDDLDRLARWSEKNSSPFNIGKRETMLYIKKNIKAIESSYKMREEKLRNKMEFKLHHDHVMNTTRRSVGFVMRNTRNFKNIQTLLTLYYALVSSHFEFSALIWNRHTATVKNRVELIQRRYLPKIRVLQCVSEYTMKSY